MRCQKREHRSGRERMPRYRIDIVNLTLTIITILRTLRLNDYRPTHGRHVLKTHDPHRSYSAVS